VSIRAKLLHVWPVPGTRRYSLETGARRACARHCLLPRGSPSVRQPGTDDQIASQEMPVQLDCTSSNGADKQGYELEIYCVSRTHVTHPPPCRLLEAVQKKRDCELGLRAGFLGIGICLGPALCSSTLVLWALVRPGLSSSLHSGMCCNYCYFCTAQDVAAQQPARDPKGLKGGPPPCFASACMRNEEALHFLFAACLNENKQINIIIVSIRIFVYICLLSAQLTSRAPHAQIHTGDAALFDTCAGISRLEFGAVCGTLCVLFHVYIMFFQISIHHLHQFRLQGHCWNQKSTVSNGELR